MLLDDRLARRLAKDAGVIVDNQIGEVIYARRGPVKFRIRWHVGDAKENAYGERYWWLDKPLIADAIVWEATTLGACEAVFAWSSNEPHGTWFVRKADIIEHLRETPAHLDIVTVPTSLGARVTLFDWNATEALQSVERARALEWIETVVRNAVG